MELKIILFLQHLIFTLVLNRYLQKMFLISKLK